MKIKFTKLLAAMPLVSAWPVDHCEDNCVIWHHGPQTSQLSFRGPCDVATWVFHCTVHRDGELVYSHWGFPLCEGHCSA